MWQDAGFRCYKGTCILGTDTNPHKTWTFAPDLKCYGKPGLPGPNGVFSCDVGLPLADVKAPTGEGVKGWLEQRCIEEEVRLYTMALAVLERIFQWRAVIDELVTGIVPVCRRNVRA